MTISKEGARCFVSSLLGGGNMFLFYLKGQMHHHDDLVSKCGYTCHISDKTTCKSVLLSTPQIWLMKVSKTVLRLGMEADIIRQVYTF